MLVLCQASPSATPPLTPGLPSRGMHPQNTASQTPVDHSAIQPRAESINNRSPPQPDVSFRNSRGSVQLKPTDSGHDTPSVQSLTQSQLADDEYSEDSTVGKGDRLPRSSRIYRKSESPGRRKSQTGDVNITDVSQNQTAPDVLDGSPKGKSAHHRSTGGSSKTPTQATFDRAYVPDLPPADQRTESPLGMREDQQEREMFISRGMHSDEPISSQHQEVQGGHDPKKGASDSVEASSKASTYKAFKAHPTHALERETQETRLSNAEAFPQPFESLPSPLEGPPKTLSAPMDEQRSNLRLPSQDLSIGRPSMDSLPSRIDADRPPSPLSPELPSQNSQDTRGRPVMPVHHGINHDFGPETEVERARRRSPSFSRPFHESEIRRRSDEPSLHEHPAYRRAPSYEELAMPEGFYPHTITHDEAQLPRQQAPEYALEGVGPPDLPPKETNSRSRRGSRSSAFFKSLAKSFTDSDSPPIPHSSADPVEDSPAASSTHVDTKSKRSSVFRLRKSQTDITGKNSRSKENVAPTSAPRSRSSTITQLPAPVPPPKPAPSDHDDEFPIRPKQKGSMSLSKKLHRASTEVSKDGDSGKRKRFSGIGSLFSMSNHKRQASSPRPSVSHSRSPSNIMPPIRQVNATHHHRDTPSQATSTYQSTPSNVGGAHNDGFYAPNQGNPLQQTPLSSPSRNIFPQAAENQPAYVQDSMLRQSTSPPPSAQNAKGPRSSVDFFRKVSQAGLIEPSSGPRQEEGKNKGRSWSQFSKGTRSRSRHSRTTSRKEDPTASEFNSFAASQAPGQPFRAESPPPPPPPPKDDWHRARPRQSSLAAPSHSTHPTTSPSHSFTYPSPNHQQRQFLPPLQTNVPSPHLGPNQIGHEQR